jgi:hypothetical protein
MDLILDVPEKNNIKPIVKDLYGNEVNQITV